VLAAVLAMAGCSKDPASADADAEGAQPGATTPAAPAEAVSAEVAALSSEQLREAASKAYRESRLYAPAGENAMEYYLALRDKQAGDAGVSSAIIDLLPMTVIATEQSRDREDFAEARRLLALIEKADSSHPAVRRLRESIATAEAAVGQRAEQQRLSAEQDAQRVRQLEQERTQQQATQQQALAAQQEAQRQAAAQAERSREEQAPQAQEPARQEPARPEQARQEQSRQEPARTDAAPAADAAPRPAPAAQIQLRAISTVAPRYPADALRSNLSGEVQVEFTVNVDGSVSNARVVRADPPRVFDREAVAAVRRWRFEPIAAPVTTRRAIAFSPAN
jgi:protein TonB